MLFYNSDRYVIGNKSVFTVLIEELRHLEIEGLTKKVNHVEQKVYIKLTVVVSDNLGMNSIFGFVESFNEKLFL